MKFKISDSLKKLINNYFNVDFDEFKIKEIKVSNGVYDLVLFNDEKHIKFRFNNEIISHIRFFEDANYKISLISKKALIFNKLNNKVDIFENCIRVQTISGKKYDFSVDKPFIVYLKLCDFEEDDKFNLIEWKENENGI